MADLSKHCRSRHVQHFMHKKSVHENNEFSSNTYMQIANHYSTESTISPIQIRNCSPVLSPQLCYSTNVGNEGICYSGVARINVTRCGPFKCHPTPPHYTSPPSLSILSLPLSFSPFSSPPIPFLPSIPSLRNRPRIATKGSFVTTLCLEKQRKTGFYGFVDTRPAEKKLAGKPGMPFCHLSPTVTRAVRPP